MSKKIIIACDNEHICDFIENYAEKEGFTVKTICDISEDTQHVVRECLILHPDIIILGGCYLDAEQECRHTSLMADIYTLKNDGGEHTLSLPLDIGQLSEVFDKYDGKLCGECDTLSIDNEHNCAKVGDKEYPLGLNELEILRSFIANPNRVFSKEQLAGKILDVCDGKTGHGLDSLFL